MRSKQLQTDLASRISDHDTLYEPKPGLAQRLFNEVIKYVSIAFYLWVMFGVFALHESVVSAKDHINYHFYGFAVMNALILGKVMLVAEDLHFADWFKDRPLVYPILCKAVAFSILFLVFDVVEEVLVGMFKGKTIGESIPVIGGGSPRGVLFVGIILAVALLPFFGFREWGRPSGERELHCLIFTGGPKAVAFQSGMRQRGRRVTLLHWGDEHGQQKARAFPLSQDSGADYWRRSSACGQTSGGGLFQSGQMLAVGLKR